MINDEEPLYESTSLAQPMLVGVPDCKGNHRLFRLFDSSAL